MHTMSVPELVNIKELADLDTLTALIMAEREKRLNLTRELMFEKQKNRQLEDFIEKFFEDDGKKDEKIAAQSLEDEEVKVGTYPGYIRRLKIKSYKQKLKKYKSRVTISRDFKGRSIAAKMKPRFNGKFAKKHIEV